MREMYAEMDVLLTLEQFQQAVPDNLACFLPYGTYILFESISLPVKCVIDVCEKPLSLLKWEPSVKSLVRVDHEVSVLKIYSLHDEYTMCGFL